MKYTVHLLRHKAKKCPQRIKDTPAVLFCLIPCIYTVYFKRLTEGLFSERTGMSVVLLRSDVFASQKLASRSVHGCTLLDRLFQKAYGKLYTTCGYWESSTYHFRHGCRWFSTGASSHCELVVKQLYRGVQLLNRLFQKAYGEYAFKSGRGVCIYFVLHKNKYLTFQNGQGCPWFYAVAMFLRSKNSRSKIDKEVNF